MLRHNIAITSALPLRYFGGDPAGLRSFWGRADRFNQQAAEGAADRLSGVPNGHLAPGAWILPRTSGGMSAYVGTNISLGVAPLNVAAGRNLEGAAAITIALPNAALQLVVSASGTATITFTSAAGLAGALYADGSAAVSFTVSTPTLGAIIDAIGTAATTLSSSATAFATGALAGEITPFTELSPQSLAAAVWQRVIESGFSAEQVLRIVAAHAAGAATGLEGANPQFTGLDGTTLRIDGTYSAGTRTIDSLNGE